MDPHDPRVLGQLLAASSAFTAFTDQQLSGQFLLRAVAGVPGVGGSDLCALGGHRPRIDGKELAECTDCGSWQEGPCAARGPCRLSDDPRVRVIQCRTPDASYGFVVCRLETAERFSPYEPFLRNLVDSLAVHIERCVHKERLEVVNLELTCLRDQLQELVDERTEELQQANEHLAEEKERLAVTLRSIGDGVITTDAQGTVTFLNGVAEELTAWPIAEAVGRPLRDVFHIVNQATRERSEDPVAKVLATGSVVGLANHTVLLAKDGAERILADSGAPIRDRDSQIVGVVLVFRDVTTEHRVEAELQNAQKLESVGLLAGGIAHDFNNLLTAILGNIALAQLDSDPDGQQAECLADAEKAVARASDLTRQLLTFSRGGAPIRKSARIGEMIADAARFSLRGSNVRSVLEVPDDLWPVEADLGQLSQVIGNLVINANEAMPDGGALSVTARNLPPGADERPASLADGPYVAVSITDQGVGIDERHIERVFEPYFTTKQRGSGLGLTTCYSIVRNHDGAISVSTRRGEGTTFCVYLPASICEPAPRALQRSVHSGRGRILVMDDEEMLRKVSSGILARLGYEVVTVPDGAAALEQYEAAMAAGRPLDAVILDITIPGGMGGVETMERLLLLDPKVKAIVSSGYSNDPVMADSATYGFAGVAVKPYDVRALSGVLEDVLSADPRPQRAT
jgi:PAS domain S-box-containing protein